MGEAYGLTDSEVTFLKALASNQVPFMIIGLSAAAMQGADVVTQDIDVWFKRLDHAGIREALRTVRAAYVAPTLTRPPMFAGGDIPGIDIAWRIHGLSEFDEEMKHTVPLRIGNATIPVLSLERIIASKRAAGRPKDALAIPVLEDAIRARQERTGHSEGNKEPHP